MRALLALAVAALPCVAQAASFQLDGNAVTLSGSIGPGDSMAFKQFLDDAPGPVAKVVLDSPGGYIDEAIGIAQTITATGAKGLDTEIEPGAMCASACNLIFAAGYRRIYHEGARFGVHQSRLTTGEISPEGTDRETKWLASFHMPQPLLARLAATPPDQITWLTDAEMKTLVLEYVGKNGIAAMTMPWLSEFAHTSGKADIHYPTKDEIAASKARLEQEYPGLFDLPKIKPQVTGSLH